ncbi:MAG: hypothetical protein IT317_16035 [Anaerolineales bacterium]|nr:hypothetical protein [Anaerolineales bacterium]
MLPHHGRAYGLTIRSAVPLPELPPAAPDAPADLTIAFGPVPDLPPYTGLGTTFYPAPADIRLGFRDAGKLAVQGGRAITLDPLPNADPRVLRLYLLGPALALALHQRGWLVLHASAVALHGRAVAFLGAPKAGKSTLAAALHQRGAALVADDVVAVSLAPDDHTAPLVYPGFPQLKLWPEAVAGLGEDPAALPALRPDLTKLARRLSAGFQAAPLPLGRVYALAEAPAVAIESLDRQAQLLELVRHSYVALALPRLDAAAHLRQCAAVLRHAPVLRLDRPRDLARLGESAAAVLAAEATAGAFATNSHE